MKKAVELDDSLFRGRQIKVRDECIKNSSLVNLSMASRLGSAYLKTLANISKCFLISRGPSFQSITLSCWNRAAACNPWRHAVVLFSNFCKREETVHNSVANPIEKA